MNAVPSDQELCEIAKAYIEEEYATEGVRVYYWEEWDDPEDDTTAHGCTSYAPPNDSQYQWSEVYSCKVTDCKIERDEDGDFICTVKADIAMLHSCDKDDKIQPAPESREIYCCMAYDRFDDCWFVDNIEE